MEQKPVITKDMIINDVIKKYPKTITVFKNYKVDACCGGGFSIEKTAGMGGINMDALIKALNNIVLA